MGRPCILVVDNHPEDLRLLEVSLKNAGFAVTTAANGRDALAKVGISPPDLVISETVLPELDGFAFLSALKENPEWAQIPFLFLSEERSVEHKVRGLELGVADYLTKPVFVKELIARLRLILQRKERERLEGRGTKTRFAGSLDDIGLVDLIQTIDLSKKTGVLRLSRGPEVGIIYFQDGEVVDAEVGRHRGVVAVYRLLTWSQGLFDVDFRPVRRERMVHLSCQEILMEGMRRLDEWGRLVEQLPSLDTVFIVDAGELMERLDEIPDEANGIIRLTDGNRTLNEIVDAAPFDDLDTLKIVTKLVFYGILVDTGRRVPPAPRADFTYGREVTALSDPIIRPAGYATAVTADLSGRIAEAASEQEAIGRQEPADARVAPPDEPVVGAPVVRRVDTIPAPPAGPTAAAPSAPVHAAPPRPAKTEVLPAAPAVKVPPATMVAMPPPATMVAMPPPATMVAIPPPAPKLPPLPPPPVLRSAIRTPPQPVIPAPGAHRPEPAPPPPPPAPPTGIDKVPMIPPPAPEAKPAAKADQELDEKKPTTLRLAGPASVPVESPSAPAAAQSPAETSSPPPTVPTLRLSPAMKAEPPPGQVSGRLERRLTPEHLDAAAAALVAKSPFVRPSDIGPPISAPPAPLSFRLAAGETPAPGDLRREDFLAEREAEDEKEKDGEDRGAKVEIVFGDAEPKVIVDMDGRPSRPRDSKATDLLGRPSGEFPPERSVGGVVVVIVLALAALAGGLYLIFRGRGGEEAGRADAGGYVASASDDVDASTVEPAGESAEGDVGAAVAPEEDAAPVPLAAADVASGEAAESEEAPVEAGPIGPVAPNPEAYEAAMAAAKAAWKSRDRDGALAGLREAALADPSALQPALQWGRWVIDTDALYGKPERCAEAVAFVRPAADANPNHGELWFYVTAFLYRARDRAAGDEAKEHCLGIRPRDQFSSSCRYLPD